MIKLRRATRSDAEGRRLAAIQPSTLLRGRLGLPNPASLARREITVMWEELLRRVSTIEVAGEVEYLRSNFVNRIKRLPARIT